MIWPLISSLNETECSVWAIITLKMYEPESRFVVLCCGFVATNFIPFRITSLALGRFHPWWRHQMETFSALLAICAGNSPVPGEFPHRGQWRGALMLSLICVLINGWVNNRRAVDLRRYRAHYDVTVMITLPEKRTSQYKDAFQCGDSHYKEYIF